MINITQDSYQRRYSFENTRSSECTHTKRDLAPPLHNVLTTQKEKVKKVLHNKEFDCVPKP